MVLDIIGFEVKLCVDIVCTYNKQSILMYPSHNDLESKKEKMSHEKLSVQEMWNIN